MKYLIHSCNDRYWYVEKYLIPSMLEQGISMDDILVYRDVNNDGCLESFIKSIDMLSDDGDTWHLQDDVVICEDFKQRTEKEYRSFLVCGFSSRYDRNLESGLFHHLELIWFSFPCIRITNMIVKHFAIWFRSYISDDARFNSWVESKKHDDLLFRYFLKNYYKRITGENLIPNLVEHVDWLIGGSITNSIRDGIVRSRYWDNEALIDQLKEKLKNEKIVVDN